MIRADLDLPSTLINEPVPNNKCLHARVYLLSVLCLPIISTYLPSICLTSCWLRFSGDWLTDAEPRVDIGSAEILMLCHRRVFRFQQPEAAPPTLPDDGIAMVLCRPPLGLWTLFLCVPRADFSFGSSRGLYSGQPSVAPSSSLSLSPQLCP